MREPARREVTTGPSPDHWRRYRRVMALMTGLAVVTIAGALAVLHRDGVVLHLQFVIAISLGIGVTLLLAGALMGLVFVSAASGHDEAVQRVDLGRLTRRRGSDRR